MAYVPCAGPENITHRRDLRPWQEPTPAPIVVIGAQTARRTREVIRMHAEVGDEIIVRGRHADDEDRKGVIIEVHGKSGAPPYLVRWENALESVLFPSSDTVVEHHPARPAAG